VNLRKFLKKILFGITVPQQYVCVGLESCVAPLTVTFVSVKSAASFQSEHVLLGYKPVIIAISHHNSSLKGEQLVMNFHENLFPVTSAAPSDKILAHMLLKPIYNFESMYFYEAVSGAHSFINLFHRHVNDFRLRFARSSAGNIDLPGTLHDRVRISYSIPRVIGLVSVSRAELMNLFPTDLHGEIGELHYVSSLRIGGKAQEQVQTHGKIVISEVGSSRFAEVYDLGKNHMQEMKSLTQFMISHQRSECFQFPIPLDAVRYFELSVISTIDIGIHRIFIYRIVNKVNVKEGNTLAHIHQYYCQWRIDHGIPTNFLLRDA
jgi:hypothetical protein